MIYLYVKTHNITGLKYLGKTKRDPFHYLGSGVHWTRHLRKYGNDVTTEILKECYSNDELKQWGLYYSDLWNVVEDDTWANLKPECGDGGDTSNTTNYKIAMAAIDKTGSKNGMFGKNHTQSSIDKMKTNRAGKSPSKQSKSHIESRRKTRCIQYQVIDPNGNIYEVDDLVTFCSTHNIPYKTMSKIPIRGVPTRGQCLGWNVKKV
jgi:hypothetical protein